MADPSPPRRQVLEGMGLALALLSAFLIVFYAALDTWADWGPDGPVDDWATIPVYMMAFCGFSQYLYVFPCFLFLKKRGLPHVARGVALGAAAILFLNLAVFILWIRWDARPP